MTHTVKAVAELAGISIRTLHHYDDIGLLKPASVSPAGYRLYTDADLDRLQQILFFRELDFSLREIQAILARPNFDRKQALLTHKQLLLEKRERLETLLRSVDRTIETIDRGTPMDQHAMFEGFDQEQLKQYRDEARARWGEVVDDSYRRAGKYTKQDWNDIQAEMSAIQEAVAAHMGGAPGGPEVQAAIDRWYRMINDRFYTCSLDVFRGLGNLYVDDERFTAHYDRTRPGLAEFMRQAMHVYCDRHEGLTPEA